jgi:parallel beta-helix repeat protein
MRTSVFKLFVKRFVSVVALVLGAAFHVPWATAQGPTNITECGVISGSGSYVLANNLTASSGDCLRFTANFVTIDLAGFFIAGNGSGFGILGQGGSFAVRNGAVLNFAFGVAAAVDRSIVEGVRATGNQRGIVTAGSATIRGNLASGNGQLGIQAGAGSTVSGNTVNENGEAIIAGSGSIITNNIVQGNRGRGILITTSEDEPEVSGSGALVSGNTVRRNGGSGIIVGRGSLVSRNVVQGNSPAQRLFGIQIAPGSTVIDNIAEGNSLNLFCGDAGANIIHNTVTPAPDGIINVIGNCTLHENVGEVRRPSGLD